MIDLGTDRYREYFLADAHHPEIIALNASVEGMNLLEVGNRSIPLSVYTPILSRDSYRSLMGAASVLERCIMQLVDLGFHSDLEPYFDALEIPLALRDIYKRTWGRNGGLMSRADCLLTENGFQFLELNIGGGAGAAMELSVVAEQIERADFFRSYFAVSDVVCDKPATAFCDCIRRVAQNHGFELFTLGIVDWSPWFEKNWHHYEKLSNSFRRLGIKSVFGSQHDIVITDDHLLLGGTQVDIVLKVFMTTDLQDYDADLARMRDIVAIEDLGKVVFLNGLHTEVYSNKVNLALLHQFKERFTGEEQQTIEEYVPFTQVARAQTVEYKGNQVELVDLVKRHRRNFVLKKGFSFAGRDVVFGGSLSDDEWAQQLAEVLAAPQPWILQECVHPLLMDTPQIAEGRVTSVSKVTVWSPYIFDRMPYGVMIRFGDVDKAKTAINASNSTLGIAFHET